MSLLLVEGLRKVLGSSEVLRGAELRVEPGERVGIVGRNGGGKTTLLRMIEGEETPDHGRVRLARGARMGYVVQRPEFEPGVTVRSYVETGLEEVHKTEQLLDQVNEELGTAEGQRMEDLLKRQGELTQRMEFLGGWEAERRVETVLGGIGLDPVLWDREACTMSGGEKSRTAMARELVSVPDLLLLDEPTNHLDLAGIEWLEDYLKSIGSSVLVVSHDRRLLNHVVDAIVELERGLLERYTGGYDNYVRQKEERFQNAHRLWKDQQELFRKEEAFIKKHMGSQRTAEAKGRKKKLSNIERLPEPFNDVRRPHIRVAKVERGGEQVLDAEGLAKSFGDRTLFEDAAFRLGRGERVGLVGPNGAGKTTLMQILAGRTQSDAGEIRRGYKANAGYFDQELTDLRDDGTPYTEIKRDHIQWTDLQIRSHLAKFLFRGEDVDLDVGSLSGGERARLTLARLVLTEPSWLCMDEPTNHLDLAGRTALEEMLSEFPGAIVCISHDRTFLDHLCTRIVEVREGVLRSFPGNYSDYLATRQAEASERQEEAQRAKKQAAENARRAAEAEEKAKAKQQNKGKGPGKQGKTGKQGKPKKKNPWLLDKLEKSIIQLEERREGLLEDLGSEEVYKDADLLRDKQMELAELERDLEEKNAEWEKFS